MTRRRSGTFAEMIIDVTYRSNKFQIDLGSSSHLLLLNLKERIYEAVKVPVHVQKLMIRKKLIVGTEHDTKPLVEFAFEEWEKISVIGATEQELAQVLSRDQKLKQKTPLKSARPYEERSSAKPISMFGTIEVLTHVRYLNQQKALQLMKNLSEDLGVRNIMLAYGWKVSKLLEICPVERPDILGYNMNQGSVIALRLRTNDLSGFRAESVIRRTLVHELTHMVHSEHNHEFWALNRQLNQEVVSRNWTKSGGNQLSSREFYQESGLGSVSGTSAAVSGGVFKLGGKSVPEKSRRELLADAAQARLSQQEQEEMDSCGQQKSKKTTD